MALYDKELADHQGGTHCYGLFNTNIKFDVAELFEKPELVCRRTKVC